MKDFRGNRIRASGSTCSMRSPASTTLDQRAWPSLLSALLCHFAHAAGCALIASCLLGLTSGRLKTRGHSRRHVMGPGKPGDLILVQPMSALCPEPRRPAPPPMTALDALTNSTLGVQSAGTCLLQIGNSSELGSWAPALGQWAQGWANSWCRRDARHGPRESKAGRIASCTHPFWETFGPEGNLGGGRGRRLGAGDLSPACRHTCFCASLPATRFTTCRVERCKRPTLVFYQVRAVAVGCPV